MTASSKRHKTVETVDVLVAGAGPAGTTAAMLMARQGFSVLLVERQNLPRYKVCGGCLNQSSLQGLIDAGLIENHHDLPATPYSAVEIHCRKQRASINLPPGIAMARADLDHTLLNRARAAGVQTCLAAPACLQPADPTKPFRDVLIESDKQTRSIRARLVIDATGLGSRFSAIPWQPTGPARVGVGTILSRQVWDGVTPPPGKLQMINARAGYIGLAHLPNEELDIAASLNPEATRKLGGVAPALTSILTEAGCTPGDVIHRIKWKGTPRLNSRRAALGGHRLLLLGDATGYIEPFTGEGMAWAIQGAHALVRVADQAVAEWIPDILRQYAYARRSLMKRQQTCKAVTAVLRYPRLTAAAIRILRLSPGLSAPVTRAINRQPAHA